MNPYFYFAGYVILQYVVIATAWNILGGYAGYVNFGTPAFFALGAYTAIFLIQSMRAPLPVLILAGGLVSALLGLGIGYLTLRLRGVFFSIATLALVGRAPDHDHQLGVRGRLPGPQRHPPERAAASATT